MNNTKPMRSNTDVPPPENEVLAAGVSCGCGMLFLVTGLLPVLALLNILPRAGFFGRASPLLVVMGGLPFAAVGLYFIGNAGSLLIRGRRLSDRLLLNLGMFFLAIPFHYWLFFGRSGGESITSISLPGGLVISFFERGKIAFITAKIAVALLLAGMDLYLISEALGLGWFVAANSRRNARPEVLEQREDANVQ